MTTFSAAPQEGSDQWPDRLGGGVQSGAGSLSFVSGPPSNSMTIVTCIDVCNTSGSSGVSFALDMNGVRFHGGQIGAGQFDTFPWRGMMCLHNGDTLTLTAVGAGTWEVIANGFRVPYFAQFI